MSIYNLANNFLTNKARDGGYRHHLDIAKLLPVTAWGREVSVHLEQTSTIYLSYLRC